MRSILAFCGLLIFCCGVLAQQPRRASKDEIQEITRQELERYRALCQVEHERWAREYEVRKHTEMQLEALRAAVARAARL